MYLKGVHKISGLVERGYLSTVNILRFNAYTYLYSISIYIYVLTIPYINTFIGFSSAL